MKNTLLLCLLVLSVNTTAKTPDEDGGRIRDSIIKDVKQRISERVNLQKSLQHFDSDLNETSNEQKVVVKKAGVELSLGSKVKDLIQIEDNVLLLCSTLKNDTPVEKVKDVLEALRNIATENGLIEVYRDYFSYYDGITAEEIQSVADEFLAELREREEVGQ